MDSGFRILPAFLRPDDLAPVVAALSSAGTIRSRAGVRHLLRIPAVRELASNERLLRLAREFIGSEPLPFRATLFDKSPTANWLVAWHQDTIVPLRRRVDSEGWGPCTIKAGVIHARAPASALAKIVSLRVHLDDSTPKNGPLRVLPGTHGLGVLTTKEIEQLAKNITPVRCLASRGDVIVMRPLTIHASSKAEAASPRRVIQIDYATQFDFGSGIKLAIS